MSTPCRVVVFGALALSLVFSSRLYAADPHEGHDHAAEKPAKVERAVAVIREVGKSGVAGLIRFDQTEAGVHVVGKITGLTPGKHAIHVHEFGDLTDMDAGMSAGGHFNPTHQPHGDRTAHERHAGDLGNLEADQHGTATIDLTDKVLQLNGPTSILGRGLVIHAEADKFTQPVGAAGGRVGLAVIGVAGPEKKPEKKP